MYQNNMLLCLGLVMLLYGSTKDYAGQSYASMSLVKDHQDEKEIYKFVGIDGSPFKKISSKQPILGKQF